MRPTTWLGPDGRRYQVILLSEPFDPRFQTIVIQRDGG
jgi:hypothetical protein